MMATAPSSCDDEPSRLQPKTSVKFGIRRYSNPDSWNFKILAPELLLSKTKSVRDMVHVFLYGPSAVNNATETKESSVDKDGEKAQMQQKELPSQPSAVNNATETKESSVDKDGEKAQMQQKELPSQVKDSEGSYLGPPDLSVSDLTNEQKNQLQRPPEDKIQVLWIGHASLLIQMEGMNILTDPVFSDTVGLSKHLGYKRYRKPALTSNELREICKKIDIVLISHNHYDHFDEKSVKELCELFPEIQWYVPMGLRETLEGFGPKIVTECWWWDSCPVGVLEVHFTPAKHWSARGPLDWYQSLWGSWVIESRRFKVFFAGDTGYQKEIFTGIRRKYGKPNLAAIPIGAYEPRAMMTCQHVNPKEAVQIHEDLGARKSIGIHWRTFQLSTEGVDQPKKELEEEMNDRGLSRDKFVTLENNLMITVEDEDVEDDDNEKEKDIFNRKCLCGNIDINSYKRYKHREDTVGVFCFQCGREWLQKKYIKEDYAVKVNSLQFEEEMLYFHDNTDAVIGEDESATKQWNELTVGDHLNWCEGTPEIWQNAIVEEVGNQGELVTVAMFERNDLSDCQIIRKQMKRSEIEKKTNSKIVDYGYICDAPELVEARMLVWCDTEMMGVFKRGPSSFFRYCKRGPDHSFKAFVFVVRPLIDSFRRLNADYTKTDVNEITSGVQVKILNEICFPLVLKNYMDVHDDDLKRNQLDDAFCKDLVKNLIEIGQCKVTKTENKLKREFEVNVSKAHVRANFTVQCIKNGRVFDIATGTSPDNPVGPHVGQLIQRTVRQLDRRVTLEDLQFGDHVVLSGTFYHPRCHAIIVSLDIKAKKMRLIRSTYEKGVVEEWVQAPSYLLLVERNRYVDTKNLVREARQKIGINDYNILTNNCKHFVEKCKAKATISSV